MVKKKKYGFVGDLFHICTYIDNKKNGEYKSYHENGQLKTICTYVDDKKNGEYKEYNDTGKLIESSMYKNNFKFFYITV